MKALTYILSLILLCCGCEEDIKIEDVFSNLILIPTEVLADGQSVIDVSVQINNLASADRRNFIFTTTAGTFIGSGTDKITVKAEHEKGLLLAKTKLRVPFSPGEFTVTVQPEYDSPIRDFILFQTVKASASNPASIDLKPSGFGITSNFASQVFLTAFLKNASNKNVSNGVPVLFEDELLNGNPAGGRFRIIQGVTADSSKVSAYYSAPSYPIGTTIKIRSTVLDEKGLKTTIKDSVLVTINL